MERVTGEIATCLFAIVMLAAACGQSGSDGANAPTQAPADPLEHGLVIYKKYCINCHGAAGALKFSGAADLSISTLSQAEAVDIITHGRNAMLPYENLLTEKEIDHVAAYIQTLKRNAGS